MSDGLQKTFEILRATPNESATRLLIAALDSSHGPAREAALPALVARRSPAGEREVLRRLHTLGPEVFASMEREHASLSRALRSAVVGKDEQTFVNACHEMLRTREYDLIPTMLAALEDSSHPSPNLAARTLLALVNLLSDETRASHAPGQNALALAKRSLECLHDSVKRYARHQRREVVESFLRLTDRHQPALLEILGNPHHPAYLIVADVLSRSHHEAVQELLIGFLEEPQAPSSALTILARRSDEAFVRRLLRFVALHESETLTRNFKRIDLIAWVGGDHELIDRLPGESQEAAIRMAMASRMNRQQVFHFVAHLLTHGHVEARRAAATALGEFTGVEANGLAMEMLRDSDPVVQAQLLPQLRARAIPGAIQRLLEKLDSPYPAVRRAAKECLNEFTFDRYWNAFDALDNEVRRSTGDLVKRIDADSVPRLRSELRSPVRKRRLRALAVAEAMELAPHVEDAIADLLADEDGFVRLEAARRLAQSHAHSCLATLERATQDPRAHVREAATRALAENASFADPSAGRGHSAAITGGSR